MVKKRDRVQADAESFIAGGKDSTVSPALNQKAPRDFKKVNLGMNEYEYDLFTRAAERSGHSLLGFLRQSAKIEAKKVLD